MAKITRIFADCKSALEAVAKVDWVNENGYCMRTYYKNFQKALCDARKWRKFEEKGCYVCKVYVKYPNTLKWYLTKEY